MSIGYVYKIFDNTNSNAYYGSTKQALSKRMANHKSNYKLWCAGKKNNATAYDIIKNGDYDISLVEIVNFEDKIELHRRERFYIENNVCVNKCIPTRTSNEYNNDNRETINEKDRKYREDNRKTMSEKMTCICGSIFRKCGHKKHDESPKHLNFMKEHLIS